MSAKRTSLGRGLDALLGYDPETESTELPLAADNQDSTHTLRQIPVEQLQRGKYQPRRDLNPEALAELADSIRAQGVMQPIVVRAIGEQHYEIIAGERRWRAAQQAGLDSIPALVRDVPDETAIAMALIENIQREDLNPIEEAQALIRLQNEFSLTQEQVAEAVGKSRSTVTNLMRLMTLEKEVQHLLAQGSIDQGHAKCLLALQGARQIKAAHSVATQMLSVRQTEALVKRLQAEAVDSVSTRQTVDPDVRRLEEELSERVGSPVSIRHSNSGGGQLTVKFNNLDELEGILAHIK